MTIDINLFCPRAKQVEIMTVILKGNPDGSFVDMNQLLARLSYLPSKSSMHSSLRALIKWGLIENGDRENRRRARRRIIQPTVLGYKTFGAKP